MPDAAVGRALNSKPVVRKDKSNSVYTAEPPEGSENGQNTGIFGSGPEGGLKRRGLAGSLFKKQTLSILLVTMSLPFTINWRCILWKAEDRHIEKGEFK